MFAFWSKQPLRGCLAFLMALNGGLRSPSFARGFWITTLSYSFFLSYNFAAQIRPGDEYATVQRG